MAPGAGLVRVVVGAACTPVQAVPLTANEVGAALVPLYEKLAPALAEPPAGMVPFQSALTTVTFLPDWLQVPLQPTPESVWLPA